MKYIFIIFFIIFLKSSLFAKEININDKSLKYIGEYTSYLEDKNSTYTINEIKNSEFLSLNKKVDGRFFTSSSIWYKLNVFNKKEDIEKYFIFDIPWIDEIDIYIFNKNKNTNYVIGNQYSFNKRSLKINLLNQKHIFEKGKSTVYFKIKTRDPFIIPISILNKEEIYEKLSTEHSIEFAIYCIVLTMLLFNFILFFIIKNSVYLYYVLFLCSYLLMSFSYNNYSFVYFLGNYPSFQNWLQSIGIYTYSITGLLFAKIFLNLKVTHPKLSKFFDFTILLYIIILLSAFFISYQTHVKFSIIIASTFTIIIIISAIYSFKKGNKSAVFFIVGAIFGLTGTTITALSAMSILPYDWFLFKSLDFGIIIDSILLSLALANRYILINNSLEKTKKELLLLNKDLETKIEERTKDLSIELSNKNILLKEINHRIKNNLQITSAFLSMDLKKIKDQNSKNVIEKNIKRLKSMSILYENFLNSNDLENIRFKIYLEKLIISFKDSLLEEEIIFDLEIEDIKIKNEKLFPLSLAINELLVNSLKHAFYNIKKPKISISAVLDKKTNELCLIYKDNGIGAEENNITKSFGLKILNALIELQLEGNLSFSNNNGLIYKIVFNLE